MEILDNIPFQVNAKQLFAKLRIDPNGDYAAEIHELVEKAQAIARPKVVYDIFFPSMDGNDETVVLGTSTFTSRVLRSNLDGIQRVFAHIATCGRELDELPVPQDNVFANFCKETIKEMALATAGAFLRGHLKGTYAIPQVAGMYPGAGDASVWPIEQQKEFFALFDNPMNLIGVELTKSCLMIPNKSSSGLTYPTEVDFHSCQLCRRKDCTSRRAPLNQKLWQEKFGEKPRK